MQYYTEYDLVSGPTRCLILRTELIESQNGSLPHATSWVRYSKIWTSTKNIFTY